MFETQASTGETEVQKSQLKEWMKPVEAPVLSFLQNRPQGDDLSRAVWGGADYRTVQWTCCSCRSALRLPRLRPATPVHPHTKRSTPGDDKCAARRQSRNISIRSAVTAVHSGGKEQNTELLELHSISSFFTGSTFVGKIVAWAAAENLTPVPARTGRDEPGAGGRDGQHRRRGQENRLGRDGLGRYRCTSPGYAYVHESVAEAFVADAKKALVELFGDDPKPNSDYLRCRQCACG